MTVVPLAGTWIETLLYAILSILFSQSFPLRERGLKRPQAEEQDIYHRSFPLRERGLKRYVR